MSGGPSSESGGPPKPPRSAPADVTRFTDHEDDIGEFEFDESHPQTGGPLGILGEYLLLERIGAGGMGEVFRAEHRTMNRLVALKVLSRAFADRKDLLERFFHEIRAVAKLMHPNIVTAFDAGSAGGVYYLVMELVEGELLSRHVTEKGPLNTIPATDMLVQAARGLDYAHRLGVIHRDIKPSNLMLSRTGTLKILDFGLAQLERPRELKSANRVFMGTVEYMSPEQIEHPEKVDARSDLYSLGATLFYLLTGKPMFGGDAMQIAVAHQRQRPPALYEVRPDIDLRLDAIFQRLVAKSPADRFPSASALIESVTHSNLLAGERTGTDRKISDGSSLNFSLSSLGTSERPTSKGTSHSTLSKRTATVGIDLGMLTSSVAFCDPKTGLQNVQLPESGQTVRNMLWSEGEQIVIGGEAVTLRQTQPDKVFHSLQRWIGLKQIERPFGGRIVPPEVPLAAMLRYLLNLSQAAVAGATHAVVTVPGCYDQMHRLAIQNACRIAGVELLQMLEKPLAAAVSWIDVNFRLASSKDLRRRSNSTLLVVHVGGTGLEASVVEVEGLTATMRGTSGNIKLGTLRWQHRLAEVFEEKFRTQFGRDIRQDLAAAARLQRTVEMVLQRLTKNSKVDVRFEWRGDSIEESLSQEALLKMAPQLVEAIGQTIRRACTTARVEPSEIDHILLTGSLLRISALQNHVRKQLPHAPGATFLEQSEVAQGAALHSQHLVPLDGSNATMPFAKSAASYDLGLLVADASGKLKPRVLIQAGATLPASVTRSLRSAGPDQSSILNMIESTSMGDSTWHRLGSLDLNRTFPYLAPQSPLQLKLSVDESGLLSTQLFQPEQGISQAFPPLDEGVLPASAVAPWKAWLETLLLCSTRIST
ncbi:MAG: Hsp70 family protein [Pirellulales bacterium]